MIRYTVPAGTVYCFFSAFGRGSETAIHAARPDAPGSQTDCQREHRGTNNMRSATR